MPGGGRHPRDGIALAFWSMDRIRGGDEAEEETRMRKHSHGGLTALALILIIGASLAGCASTTAPGPSAFVTPAPPPQQEEYLLRPGDAIDITFYYHPDNNQQNLLIRPDGKVLFAMIGEVQAAGLTTAQLADEIAKKSSVYLRDPRVSVNVRTLNQNHIFVGGEVGRPGFLNYVPGLTAVQAMVQAGGWKDTADLKEVVLLQRVSETSNEYRPSKLNLAQVVENGDPKADVVLGPSDIVVVPMTGIARANVWMKQYVLNMFPIRISASPF
jgi:protein involved in polysaccharide export with SLBB domain